MSVLVQRIQKKQNGYSMVSISHYTLLLLRLLLQMTRYKDGSHDHKMRTFYLLYLLSITAFIWYSQLDYFKHFCLVSDYRKLADFYVF